MLNVSIEYVIKNIIKYYFINPSLVMKTYDDV